MGGEPSLTGQRPEETLKHQLAELMDRTCNNASAELALRRAGGTLGGEPPQVILNLGLRG